MVSSIVIILSENGQRMNVTKVKQSGLHQVQFIFLLCCQKYISTNFP